MAPRVYIALLRAVNLGGATQVGMAELRKRLTRSGLGEVRTLLQSGNVVFRSPEGSAAAVERSLNSEIAPALGPRTEFLVRTPSEWTDLIAQNPFPREAESDPAHLVVTVLRDPPSPSAWRNLQAAIPGREQVRGIGREAYLVYPDGIGRSKLTAKLIESRLGTRGTSRNWNTVLKLQAFAAE